MESVTIQFNKESSIPMYIQLSKHIGMLIKEGKYKENEKLPPIRKLAALINVNNVTVVNAYKNLERKGYIKSMVGSGYYVTYKEHAIITTSEEEDDSFLEYDNINLMSKGQLKVCKNTTNFASANPDPSQFPVEDFKRAINEVLDRDKGLAFGYQESKGYKPLRASFTQFLKRYMNVEVAQEDLQIVSGAQQGIDIISKALINPEDYVITENPTYTGALSVFKGRGANIIGVDVNIRGINLSDLERKIVTYNPKLIYVMTKFQNPTTISYSEDTLEKLLDLANKYNVYIVEDDSLSGLNYMQEDNLINLKALDKNNKVIYVKSFSKLLMPGLRIGFIAYPPEMQEQIIKAKHSTDISSSGLIQRAMQLYLDNGNLEKHVEFMKKIFKKKYDSMNTELKALRKYGVNFIAPRGGLHFWIKLPKGVNALELYSRCSQRDVLIVPCNIFYVNPLGAANNTIRLSFAAVDEEGIIKGLNILKEELLYLLKYTNEYSEVHEEATLSPMI